MEKRRKQLRIFEYVQQLECLKDGPESVKEVLDNWEAVLHYAYIVHDKDDIAAHVHFVVRLQGNRDITTIANRLSTKEQYIQTIQTSFNRALCYLTHKTPKAQLDGKHHYDDDEVIANFPWTVERDKALKNIEGRRKDDEYLQMVAVGLIKPYEINELIPLESRLRIGKQKLTYATEIYMETLCVDREMSVIFISGETGTGKTTLAKRICRDKKMPFFVSGTGADWLDGYRCEPAIILDDARPHEWRFSEWLKLTDNHTAARAWSRYKSKAMAACQLLIITTTLSVDNFIRGFKDIGSENIRQAERRIGKTITLSGTEMTVDSKAGRRRYNYSLQALLRGEDYISTIN